MKRIVPTSPAEEHWEMEKQNILKEMRDNRYALKDQWHPDKDYDKRNDALKEKYAQHMRSRPEPGEGRSMTSTEKKVVGGLAAGAGLATLLAGGYALFKHFQGDGDMNPPGEAQPEDPAPDNAFMSPQVRTVIDKKLAVRKPRKAIRKTRVRRRKRL